MKRKIPILLIAALLCLMLSGCLGVKMDVKINQDGSGSMSVSAGMSKEALEEMSGGEPVDLSEHTSFVLNGKTFYGEVETTPFTSVDDFQSKLAAQGEDGLMGSISDGGMKLVKNADGSFTLSLEIEGTATETEGLGADMSDEELEALMDEMAIVFSFEFPSDVKQTAGPTAGITIVGNKLTIDVLKLEPTATTATYVFTTAAAPSQPINPTSFSDVSVTAWYYDAVTAMAEGGLVNGVGSGKFNPEGTMTYAEFCQLLAKAKLLETGEENGYWAYKAIEACVDSGYILDRGAYTQENYGVPITREVAVSAMLRGRQITRFLPVYSYGTKDIPDYSLISDVYKQDILNAYRYGLTNGVDANRTFNPKASLTRGQVCQLFYNLEWTAPSKDLPN